MSDLFSSIKKGTLPKEHAQRGNIGNIFMIKSGYEKGF